MNTFASQKHFLLAVSFLVVLGTLLLRAAGAPAQGATRGVPKALWLFAVVTSVLPLFHAHAFLAALPMWGGVWMIRRSRACQPRLPAGRPDGRAWLALIGTIVALAVPWFWWYAGAISRSGFVQVSPGYLAAPGVRSFVLFWFANLGPFLPIVVWALLRTSDRAIRWVLGVPAGVLFLLGNVVQLQPYRWDNYKVFLFGWFLVLPVVVAVLVQAFVRRGSPVQRALARAVVVVIVLSATLTTISETRTYLRFRAAYPVYTSGDRAVARTLDRALPRDAVVLAAAESFHRHPLTLTGRQLVSGYGGWIWTRGLSWDKRSGDIRAALLSASLNELCGRLTQLGTTHVVIGLTEREEWGNTSSPFVANLLGLQSPSSKSPLVLSVREKCRGTGVVSRKELRGKPKAVRDEKDR